MLIRYARMERRATSSFLTWKLPKAMPAEEYDAIEALLKAMLPGWDEVFTSPEGDAQPPHTQEGM